MEVYDTFGSLKMQQNIKVINVILDTQSLNNGIFFLRITYQDKVIYQYKIAVQH